MMVIFLLRRGENQAGIGGRIRRFERANRFKIARVRDDRGKFLDLIELI